MTKIEQKWFETLSPDDLEDLKSFGMEISQSDHPEYGGRVLQVGNPNKANQYFDEVWESWERSVGEADVLDEPPRTFDPTMRDPGRYNEMATDLPHFSARYLSPDEYEPYRYRPPESREQFENRHRPQRKVVPIDAPDRSGAGEFYYPHGTKKEALQRKREQIRQGVIDSHVEENLMRNLRPEDAIPGTGDPVPPSEAIDLEVRRHRKKLHSLFDDLAVASTDDEIYEAIRAADQYIYDREVKYSAKSSNRRKEWQLKLANEFEESALDSDAFRQRLQPMDGPPIKGSPGARGEIIDKAIDVGVLEEAAGIDKSDFDQIEAMIEMRRNLGLNLGGGADESLDFIHQVRTTFGELPPEEFAVSQEEVDAFMEKLQKYGERQYSDLSPASQQARAHWGYGQPGDVRQFPTEERRKSQSAQLSKEAQEAIAKHQEEFSKAITEMKQPGLRAATLKGVFKKLGTVGAKLGGVGTAVDLLWPAKLEGDPYKASESATGVPKGWTGPEWRERQERDVAGAEWLSQQPGYGDTPPWANVPSRPRDPEAYEMLAPGQQKQEDRLKAVEEAVRMDEMRKRR